MDLELLLWGVPILVLLSALKAFLEYCGLSGKALQTVSSLLLALMVGLVLKMEDLVALLPWLADWGPIGMACLVAFLINMGFYPQVIKAAAARDKLLVGLAAAIGVVVVLLL